MGKVGLEPTVFLTLRIYSPLHSPLCILAHIDDGYGSRTHIAGLKALRPDHLDESAEISVKGLEPLETRFLAECVCHFRHTDV